MGFGREVTRTFCA